MRPAAIPLVFLVLLFASQPADADDGLRWRRTTPRAIVAERGDLLELRVPAGRAWGVSSQPLPLEPGRAYRARVELDVPRDRLRGTFLRVALYERADGRGRQRLRIDSRPLLGAAEARVIDFVVPHWAHSAKLRVLVRADADMPLPVRASRAGLYRIERAPPEVILRPRRGRAGR